MTREEAIKFLKLMRKAVSNFEEYGHDKASMVIECDKAEAVDMAIEALHREEAEEKGYCHRIMPKDVKVVVRCKDCKHLKTMCEDEGTCYYWCKHWNNATDDWGHCYYGERRGL